jgi:phosphatidylinositol alpha-mannosyltransferase
MKIGLVTPYVYPLPGGVNQHVRYLYENLRLRGHDVRILTSSHGLQRASDGDVIRIGKGFSMPANGSVGTITVSPRFLSQVRTVLDREQFDLLHFHEPFVPFLSLVVLGLSNSVNVATFHAFGGFSPAYSIGSRLMRPSVGRIHGRIAVSAAARHFVDRFFPGDYKIIPNGVDIGRFERAVPIARWQDGTKNILFVGRFESRKGLLDLLKAYRILRKTGCQCRLLVVGGGPQEKEMRRYLMTRKLGGVEFLGRVSDDERRAVQDGGHLRFPATGRESFGIVLLEAMAAGTPIVASDIHGYKGVVRRGREGLLVPPRSPKSIAASVGRLLRDRELAREMSESGRGRAEEFSWPRVTAKVDDYYGFVIRRLAAGGTCRPGSGRRCLRRRRRSGRDRPPDRRTRIRSRSPPSTRPVPVATRPPSRRRRGRSRRSRSSGSPASARATGWAASGRQC